MNEPLGDRADAMAHRIEAAALRAGIGGSGAADVTAAFHAAMRPRRERLPDDHHPDFLHPGRTALILIEDLSLVDSAIAAAGALAETLRPELAVDMVPQSLESADRIRAILHELPTPGLDPDLLLERLVSADEATRLVALAERLDHARHLHLREAAGRDTFHKLTCTVYLPVAGMTHPTLGRRFRWWCAMFARRFLPHPATP